jgi:hypothetical protein
VLDHTTAMEFNPGSMEPLLHEVDIESSYPETVAEMNPETTADIGLPPPSCDISELYHKFRRDSSYIISDQQALLCPSTVRGYSLKDKCWMEFKIDDIQDIEWDSACLPKLQIDPTMRNTLACLVSKHNALGKRMKDVVAEKGKGLAFLFHGPPGSGKTLTAGTLHPAP